METRLYQVRLSEVLSRLLEKSGVSCYKIHTYTGIDQGYLNRLRYGEKVNPSFEVLIKIGLALTRSNPEIRVSDIEELFNTVGRTLKIK